MTPDPSCYWEGGREYCEDNKRMKKKKKENKKRGANSNICKPGIHYYTCMLILLLPSDNVE